MSQTALQLSGEADKTLSHDRRYRATGQLQAETLGNGVKLRYTYEPDTQRLTEKRATRLSDNKEHAKQADSKPLELAYLAAVLYYSIIKFF